MGGRFKLFSANKVKGDDCDSDSLQVSLPYPEAGPAQQGDQLNMAVFFCYLLKMTSYFLKGTRITRPCLTGHLVLDGNLTQPFSSSLQAIQVQPEQINMAVLFWYLGKSDANVHTTYMCCTVAYAKQVKFY